MSLQYGASTRTAELGFRQAGPLRCALDRPDLPASEDSEISWVLGAGNVATLAFMCALLQLDVRANQRVLTPLLFLKLASSAGYAGIYARTRHPFFLSATLLDAVTAYAIWHFARSAYCSLDEQPEVVPPVGRAHSAHE